MTDVNKDIIKECYKDYTKGVDEGKFISEINKINYDPISWIIMRIIKDKRTEGISPNDIIDEVINIIMGVN